jgi:heme/copper-type cytochrome/quinol oxidase subunit 4
MITLGGMLGLMILAIIIGKKTKTVYPSSYIVIVLIALIQVFLVLYSMFTMSEPKP